MRNCRLSFLSGQVLSVVQLGFLTVRRFFWGWSGAVAIAIGRLGCFVGGLCYGTPTDLPWAVTFDTVDGLPRHPTQLYESLFHASAACLLAVLQSRRLFDGNRIKLYLMMYAAYRFASEFIRPEARWQAGLTGYQWSCIVIFVGFAGLWFLAWQKQNAELLRWQKGESRA